MTDIVERLRSGEACVTDPVRCRVMDARSGCTCAEAADEIERLRLELVMWEEEAVQCMVAMRVARESLKRNKDDAKAVGATGRGSGQADD